MTPVSEARPAWMLRTKLVAWGEEEGRESVRVGGWSVLIDRMG